MLSKVNWFKLTYLDEEGCSQCIERYKLPKGLSYTSGDSPVFRSDSLIGKEYKMFRFSPRFDIHKKSQCWNMTSEEEDRLRNIHRSLVFPKKNDADYHGGGLTVYYIQFFGKCEKTKGDSIRADIKKVINTLPCANCGSSQNIECDHKNDLKNDPRVLDIRTQSLDDFQPLCKHCNDVKRSVKSIMLKSNKRIGARYLGFVAEFTEGTYYLDKSDPNWYKGTYWGDCHAFKSQGRFPGCV